MRLMMSGSSKVALRCSRDTRQLFLPEDGDAALADLAVVDGNRLLAKTVEHVVRDGHQRSLQRLARQLDAAQLESQLGILFTVWIERKEEKYRTERNRPHRG